MMESGKESTVVTCPKCGKTFKNEAGLKVHMSLAHKSSTSEPSSKSKNPNPSSNFGDFDMVLGAMRMLDEGHSPIEIMEVQKIDINTMKQILQEYRELKSLSRPEKAPSEAIMEIAKLFGERIRDACDSYNDETGVCNEFSLYDIDPEFKRAFPGLFKGSGGKTRFHVGNHPWICAFCRRGIRRGGE
jgi:uncharacterized C2H2 Zn-finger protein